MGPGDDGKNLADELRPGANGGGTQVTSSGRPLDYPTGYMGPGDAGTNLADNLRPSTNFGSTFVCTSGNPLEEDVVEYSGI